MAACHILRGFVIIYYITAPSCTAPQGASLVGWALEALAVLKVRASAALTSLLWFLIFIRLPREHFLLHILRGPRRYKMNYHHHQHATSSGSRTARRNLEFGRTYVVRPKGKHQATIVWLHGLGDNGSSASQLLESLPLTNIKWICPTAPTRPVALLGGFPCTAWFNVGEISEEGPADWEGLDASAAHIANLLSTEPADVKLGIGGFSMGAATAIYSATCFALGRYVNGNPYMINLRAVIGLSGWLPGARSLRNKMEGSNEALRRAASLPMLLCHGNCESRFLFLSMLILLLMYEFIFT
ncbi:hypothetical protein SAY87_012283 [Trapa incisa]|uniref:Phospholipase/carboxylesterase/thioesterase domain-containing protein n=1 Tax=Trapa incisa TaxID=236973 RepID=A0AAN7JC11_9MYRT|nr:hypothetical protein SAY87_012283 [Trapa incisa]